MELQIKDYKKVDKYLQEISTFLNSDKMKTFNKRRATAVLNCKIDLYNYLQRIYKKTYDDVPNQFRDDHYINHEYIRHHLIELCNKEGYRIANNLSKFTLSLLKSNKTLTTIFSIHGSIVTAHENQAP